VMDRLATNGITHIAIMTNSRKAGAGGVTAPVVAPAVAPAAPTAPARGGGGK